MSLPGRRRTAGRAPSRPARRAPASRRRLPCRSRRPSVPPPAASARRSSPRSRTIGLDPSLASLVARGRTSRPCRLPTSGSSAARPVAAGQRGGRRLAGGRGPAVSPWRASARRSRPRRPPTATASTTSSSSAPRTINATAPPMSAAAATRPAPARRAMPRRVMAIQPAAPATKSAARAASSPWHVADDEQDERGGHSCRGYERDPRCDAGRTVRRAAGVLACQSFLRPRVSRLAEPPCGFPPLHNPRLAAVSTDHQDADVGRDPPGAAGSLALAGLQIIASSRRTLGAEAA